MKALAGTACAMLMLLIPSLPLRAQCIDPQVFKIKKGDVLVYDVSSKGDFYSFIITISDFGAKIAFDWEMTSPINKKGSVEMRGKAVSSGMEMINFFTSGPMVLENKTAVWLSRDAYKGCAEGKSPELIFDGNAADKMLLKNTSKQYITYKGNSMELDVIDLSNDKSFFDKKTFSVLKTSDNPLITKMNLGWTIELVEVR